VAQQVREIMTSRDLATVSPQASVVDVARLMREKDVGDVLVVDGDRLSGIVTDRDLVVRVLAEGEQIGGKHAQDACSGEVVAVSPDDEVDTAVRLMREKSVRRLPVVEGGRPVGVVSLGDLAIERGPDSALGDISAAKSNT
jgi:CBS domain-containing protein